MLKFSDQKSNRRKFSVALRYKHEKYNEDCVQTKVKHPAQVHVRDVACYQMVQVSLKGLMGS